MLFLHKGAAANINFAVYSKARPKNNDSNYELITPQRMQTVVKLVTELAPRLGVPSAAIPQLLGLLKSWLKYTAYDEKQLDIYGMMSPDGMTARLKAKLPAEWRYYNNYVDLVLALNGEVLSRENLLRESLLAVDVLNSPIIYAQINDAAKKVNAYVLHKFEGNKDELINGGYKTLHMKCDTWDKWTGLVNSVNSTERLIPVLHDISKSFKELAGWNEPPMAEGRITKINMRMNVSTPNEDSNWTASARRVNIPIWAAPSYTAHLMLQMAHTSGADIREIQALAYGIYAYWNRVYPHTATPVHRLYGVMTAASEFGVSDVACNPETLYNECASFIRPAKL